eukprot:472698_1
MESKSNQIFENDGNTNNPSQSALQLIDSLINTINIQSTNEPTYINIDIKSDRLQNDEFDCKSIQNCIPTHRIINAIIYYSTLRINLKCNESESKSDRSYCHSATTLQLIESLIFTFKDSDEYTDKDKFIKYTNKEYPHLLNDYIHIMEKHYNDIDNISSLMLHDFGLMNPCDASNCLLLFRHFRDRNNDNIANQTKDTNLLFYIDIMDSIHCYLIHLYDIGMRAKVNKQHPNMIIHNNLRNSDEIHYFNEIFFNISETIKEKRKNLQKLNLFKDSRFENAKFKINSNLNNFQDQDLLSDALYDIMLRNNFRETIDWLHTEEFDTDSIEADIDLLNDPNGQNSNLRKCFRSNNEYNLIKEYLYDVKLYQRTLSVGLKFDYWINNCAHCKDKYKPLFVFNKYDTFKDEILNNKVYTLTLHQFQISLHKINKYYHSKKVKKMVCKFSKYGILSGEIISISHLLSICIYCDWSDLCAAYRSTFRKSKLYETLASVIKRNEEFAIMSKLIIETVRVYGRSIQGIFFCGMSHMVLPLPEIKVYCPTSTTSTLEIAQMFGGDDGIVIQFYNISFYSNTFCTSWLSNYASEDEWLVANEICGDSNANSSLLILNVIIQSTSQGFGEIFRALYVFHTMLGGCGIMSLEEKYVTDKDYFILSDLINQKLGTNTSKYKYPKYVHNTFHAFTNHMTKIDLNLKYINTVCLKLKSLILHLSSQNKIKSNKIEENSGTCAETLSGQENKNNVIKKIILELFKNLTEITIFIYDEYQFDLLLFLNEISGSSLFSTNNIKITIEGYKHMRNDSILKKYLIVSGTYNEVDDILIITRNIMGPNGFKFEAGFKFFDAGFKFEAPSNTFFNTSKKRRRLYRAKRRLGKDTKHMRRFSNEETIAKYD